MSKRGYTVFPGNRETLAEPPRHCTIHHESSSVAPREISCFTGRSDYALRLSFFVQDGAATDCQDDEMLCTVTSVAEARSS